MPAVSVIIPVYRSQGTLKRALQCLDRQSFRDFDVWVVDSSPLDTRRRIVEESLPSAHYLRSEARLLPQAALNRGIKESDGELLAFLDSDVYAKQDWLGQMVRAHQEHGEPVVGGVGLVGNRWLDSGIHLAKFDKWLTGARPHHVEEAPTASLLVARETWTALGGFDEGTIHADTDFGWRLRDEGGRIWFQPTAVVDHHHLHSWPSFLHERFERGTGFARLRIERQTPGRAQIVGWLIISILPFRLASQFLRVTTNAARAGYLRSALTAAPVVSSGLYAWLLGESVGYFRSLMRDPS